MNKYNYWYANIKRISTGKKMMIKGRGVTPRDVYHMKYEDLCAIFGEERTEKIILSRKTWDIDKEWEALEKKDIKYVTLLDEEYPSRMRELAYGFRDISLDDYDNRCDTVINDKKYCNVPFGLYYKGRLPENDKLSAAVVGARQCSPYGKAEASEIGKILGRNKVNVISGLARGVDGIAQQGALDGGGETFGVLGCGVDICYPASNIDLYMELEEKGGLISEQPPGMKPLSQFFPARNRIISALADIVIVVEAKIKSGSLITADMALDQGRDVIAVPGRVTDKTSEGCNMLISQGAEIYTGPETLEKRISEIAGAHHTTFVFDTGGNTAFTPELTEKEAKVYACLDLRPKRLENILEECPLPFSEVMGTLMDLEVRGFVAEASRNTYYINR